MTLDEATTLIEKMLDVAGSAIGYIPSPANLALCRQFFALPVDIREQATDRVINCRLERDPNIGNRIAVNNDLIKRDIVDMLMRRS